MADWPVRLNCVGSASERFRAKWVPVRVKKNAPKQKTGAGPVLISIRTGPAPGRDGYEISVVGRKRPLRVKIPVLRPTLRRREPGHPGEARLLITAMENTE